MYKRQALTYDWQLGRDATFAVIVASANGVVPSGPVPLGSFTLPAGPHRLRVTIAGRNRQSSGDLAGIDNLRLVPATEPR